jgi:hypothetical protein
VIKAEDITVIIPHLGGSDEAEYSLDMCLESLEKTKPEEMKIMIAINGRKCKKHKGNFTVKSQGQCKAVNAATAATNTKWIMVTNDDMVYPQKWFSRLTADVTPSGPRNYLCFSPKLIEPRPGAPTFEVYFCGGAGGDFNKPAFYDFATEYYRRETLGWRTGFNLPFVIRRDLWETIGGYDVNYDPWGSNGDSDLEYKVRLAGVQPMQNTKAVVYHFSQTSGTFEPKNQGYWNKNWDYFIKKWGFERTDDRIWEADFPMPDEIRRFRPEWEGKYGQINP